MKEITVYSGIGDWLGVYPHNVFLNMLLRDGKYLEFSIGQDVKSLEDWDRYIDKGSLDKYSILTDFIVVNNIEEHNEAFETLRSYVESYILVFGRY